MLTVVTHATFEPEAQKLRPPTPRQKPLFDGGFDSLQILHLDKPLDRSVYPHHVFSRIFR
jgi:hypothetical protein